MTAAGIVAEYNPLHTGHFYHISKTRKQADGLIVVMSGNAVQRGGPAFFSKWDRARAAVKCGADLVLELPAVWASAPAERFAAGAVEILAGCGCVKMISCGSESGNAGLLIQAAEAVRKAENSPLVSQLLKTGITYAAAREEAVRQIYGYSAADLLHSPNNILAIEYLKANAGLAAPMEFFTVQRQGAVHDSDQAEETASASMLRGLYAEKESDTVISLFRNLHLRFLPMLCSMAEQIPTRQDWNVLFFTGCKPRRLRNCKYCRISPKDWKTGF